MANRYSLSGDRKRYPIGNIGRVILTLIVIVTGIYIAFQIEDFKESKRTEALEQKGLKKLLDQSEINQSKLNADQKAEKTQLAYLNKLLKGFGRQTVSDSLKQAIRYLLMPVSALPVGDFCEAFILSGGQRIIKSDSIRVAWSNYRRTLSDLSDAVQRDIKLIEAQLELYLINKQVLSILEPYENQEAIDIPKQQINRIIRILRRDRTFIDLIYLRMHRIRDVIRCRAAVQSYLEQIVSLSHLQLEVP